MRLLKIENLKKVYIKDKEEFTAVKNVNLEVKEGECVGLVGESGCGKSTIARIVTSLEKYTLGNIFINNVNIEELKNRKDKELYKQVQMIFQNPIDSFNPRIKLGNSIGEIKTNLGYNKKEIKQEVIELLNQVGLSEDYYNRYPKEVSGGEGQRAAIARALLIKPKLLVCDEATSALDVSVQGQIINLLSDIKEKTKTGFLFISHDLALVQNFCDTIYVMYQGEIVERGSRDNIINSPTHPYTKLLLSSNFSIYEDDEYFIDEFEEMNDNEIEDNMENTNSKCSFYKRCPFKNEVCKNNKAKLKEISQGHFVSCCNFN